MNRRSFLTALGAVTATVVAPFTWAAAKIRGRALQAWDPMRGDLFWFDGDSWVRLTRETVWLEGELHPMVRSQEDLSGQRYGCSKPSPIREGNESTGSYRPNQRITHKLREGWPISLAKDDFSGEHDPGTRRAALDRPWPTR